MAGGFGEVSNCLLVFVPPAWAFTKGTSGEVVLIPTCHGHRWALEDTNPKSRGNPGAFQVPPTQLMATNPLWDISGCLNQKLFPFPGRAMAFWRAGTQRQTWGSSWDKRGHLSERWHSTILFCHESRGKDQRTPCWCFMNLGPWKLLGQWLI